MGAGVCCSLRVVHMGCAWGKTCKAWPSGRALGMGIGHGKAWQGRARHGKTRKTHIHAHAHAHMPSIKARIYTRYVCSYKHSSNNSWGGKEKKNVVTLYICTSTWGPRDANVILCNFLRCFLRVTLPLPLLLRQRLASSVDTTTADNNDDERHM